MWEADGDTEAYGRLRATGASCRYAIHSPVTKTLMGETFSRTMTQPTPKLSGIVIEDAVRQLYAQLASADFT